jgi:glycosyltransferase involved in cell wall biosynthesis
MANLTVLPAVDEGFGMALVEAQLCGCAVMGATSGGLLDIITDGQTGYLVSPDDPRAWANAIRGALTDHATRRRMAQQGRESAVRNFSSAAVGERYLGWYRRLALPT